MDLFKQILRHVVQHQAEKLVLRAGELPTAWVGGTNSELDEFSVLPEAFFAPVLEFLLPKDIDLMASGKPQQGSLKIPGVGDVKLIGLHRSPQTIYFYFKNDASFEKDWADLEARAMRKPTMPAPPVKAVAAFNGDSSSTPQDGVAAIKFQVARKDLSDDPSAGDDLRSLSSVEAANGQGERGQGLFALSGVDTRNKNDAQSDYSVSRSSPQKPLADSESEIALKAQQRISEESSPFKIEFAGNSVALDQSGNVEVSHPGLSLDAPLKAAEEESSAEGNQLGRHEESIGFRIELALPDGESQSSVDSEESDAENPFKIRFEIEPRAPAAEKKISPSAPTPEIANANLFKENIVFDAPVLTGKKTIVGQIGGYEAAPPANVFGTFAVDQKTHAAGTGKQNAHPNAAPVIPGASHVSAAMHPVTSGGGMPMNQTMPPNQTPDHHLQQPVKPQKKEINFGPDQGGMAVSDVNNVAPIDLLFKEMIDRKASDLHLSIGQPIIFRIDGEVVRSGDQLLSPDRMKELLLPIFPQRNIEDFVDGSDTDFAYEVVGVGRFRVNVFRNRMGVAGVMRHIPSKVLTADELSLPPVIRNFCNLNKGLVVVTGPTGSGKSTTLAAMVDLINKTRKDHILTIEDPIEFVHKPQMCLINQREVFRHTKSFARALKAALREDPDIVLIGEMRDLETVAIALETAETGHLVFGTLHTNTAISTIDRIIDQFSADQQEQIRTMLASSLRGVVAQTLVRRKNSGRAAAHEILVMNDAVASMIRERKNHMIANHMVTQKAEGNVLLNESLARLVVDDKVALAEAFDAAVDKKGFIELGKRLNLPVGPLEASIAVQKKSA
jgi:twitching motility protein PilT